MDDAMEPDDSWEANREDLIKAIHANVKDWFQLDDAAVFYDYMTSEPKPTSSFLSEISERIAQFEAPPFLLQRLTELAHLTHNAAAQYKRHEGFKYLNAVLKTIQVRSTAAVFDIFELELDSSEAGVRQEIKLEAIPWLEGVELGDVEAGPHLSLESPDYL